MSTYTIFSYFHLLYSTGDGITARELADILASGKQDCEIETQGNALEEATKLYASNKEDKKRYLRVMKNIAQRLKEVEENGYEPPAWIFADHDEEVEDEEAAKDRSSSISEEGKKRKKKKRKQGKKEETEACLTSTVPPAPVVAAPVEKKVDPLVNALLGMGFAEEQIYAAAKACGGLERATADQMVMWILSGGEESPSTPTQNADTTTDKSSSSEAAFIPTTSSRTVSSCAKSAPSKAKKPPQQAAATLRRAQKENMEAVKREEEARAHADRLAAKREEQRRRNREWNNRALNRQKEELEFRAQEEARRIAKVRAAAQRQAAAGPLLAEKANIHAPARTAQAPAPTQILQRPAHMPVGGIPVGMVPRPYASAPAADANMMRYSGQGYGEYDGMAQYVSSGNSVSSAGSGRNVATQYVSSGNSVSSAGSGMPAVAAQYISSGNSVSSGGSGMYSAGMMQYQTQQQPMYRYPASTVPPPAFQSFGGTPNDSAGSTLSMSEDTSASYEESTSGEIRATARSFVPSGFKPILATQSDSTSASGDGSISVPVSSLPGTNVTLPALSVEDPLASLLSAAIPPGREPANVTPTPSATEEQALNAIIGFDLNGSTDHSSLLGSLSLSSANGSIEDTAVSSIWGSTSLAPGAASLPGFGATVADPASDAGVGDRGSGLWTTSSLNQPDTSRLSGIW